MDKLFKKIGGFDAIDMMAEDYTMRILNDPQVSVFYEGFDHAKVYEMQRMGMALLLGASYYDDEWISQINRKLVEQTGFSDKEYDRMSQHLVDTLESFNFSPEDVTKVAKFVESKRNVVLNHEPVESAKQQNSTNALKLVKG